jgi:hypothetical protein
MRQALWCVVFGCLVLSTGEAAAFTGRDYQKLSATERALYVAGAVEGWFAADKVLKARPSPLFNSIFGKIVRCVSGRLSTVEVRAIVDRYLTKNPSERNQPLGELITLALEEVCRP